eukprot:EG_transcript_15733
MGEEDVADWCKAELHRCLAAQTLYAEEDGTFCTTDVYSSGKATSNAGADGPRLNVEFVVLVGWQCRARGKVVEGRASVGNVGQVYMDNPQFDISLTDTAKDDMANKALLWMRTRGRPKLQELLDTFWDQARLKFGMRCFTGEGDESLERRELARHLVTWTALNMLTAMRLAWLSSKALAARTLITGLMTAGGAFMLGGPLALAAAGAVVGGGCGGYKGWLHQRENFAEFCQAFFETDRVLLVDMMARFLQTPAGQGVTLEGWEGWVRASEHQRLILVHYCKELSDDGGGAPSAAAPGTAGPSAGEGGTAAQKCAARLRQYCCTLPRLPFAPPS